MAGRPTKYNEAIQERADEYVKTGYAEGEVVPTQEGLSLYLDIALSTVKDWRSHEDKPLFSATLDRLMAKQSAMLASGALRGDMNATIAKLMLHNHGYSDKVQQDNTSSDRSMTPQAFPTEIIIKAKDITDGD